MTTKKQRKTYYTDIANKIEWEGGLCEYFIGYGFEGGFDFELDQLVNALQDAKDNLEFFLEEKYRELGVQLDE